MLEWWVDYSALFFWGGGLRRCLCMCLQCPKKTEEANKSSGNGSSGAGITDGFDYHVYWKSRFWENSQLWVFSFQYLFSFTFSKFVYTVTKTICKVYFWVEVHSIKLFHRNNKKTNDFFLKIILGHIWLVTCFIIDKF